MTEPAGVTHGQLTFHPAHLVRSDARKKFDGRQEGCMSEHTTENDAGITDAQIEWREQVGQRLMLAMTCQHGSDYFGSGAVCETCFANVQRIGHLIERIAAQAWDAGYFAALDDRYEGRTTGNPYRVIPPGLGDKQTSQEGTT